MRGPRLLPMCGPVDQIMTSWPGCATGRRRSINWSIRVKMAVLAPMPRESDATATKVNSGLRRRLRRANRRSKRNLAMAYKVSTPQAQKSLQKEWDRRSVFVVFLVLDSPGGCLTGHKKKDGLSYRRERSRAARSLNRILPSPPEWSCRAMPPSDDLGFGSVKSITVIPLRMQIM